MLVSSTAAVAQVDSGRLRGELMVQLSDALDAFDRGSATMHIAPDSALTAFRESRDKFRAVIDAGVTNGQLYYNLGNAHLRLGELGHAIAAYRRASRLIPGDEQLKANLRFARSLTHDQIPATGTRTALRTVFFWHYSLPLRIRVTAGLILYGLFWILAAGRRMAPRLPLGYPALVCLLVWVSLAISAAVDLPSQGRLRDGVLVANDVVVRKGNGEGYDAQFKQPLHEGVEFKLIEHRGGWMDIELPDGNRGWVRQRDAELF